MRAGRLFVLLVLLGVVVTLLVAGSVTVAVLMWPDPGRAFDATAWQEQRQDESNQAVRLDMADRLVARQALEGKSRPEVVAMLGGPDGGTYWPEWDLAYYLGPERGWVGIDSEWLVVRLGDDGRVTESLIVTD